MEPLYTYEHAWDIILTLKDHMPLIRKAFVKKLTRCREFVMGKKDFSFLHRLGIEEANEGTAQAVFSILYNVNHFNIVLMVPFGIFIQDAFKSNPFLFYEDSTAVPAKRISNELFLQFLRSLDETLQVSAVELLSNDIVIRDSLLLSIDNNNDDLFNTAIEKCGANALRISSLLAVHNELCKLSSMDNTVYADIISFYSLLQTYIPGILFSRLPPAGVTTLYEGYLTSSNCVEKLINTYEQEMYLFSEGISSIRWAESYRGDIRFQNALTLFYQDNNILPAIRAWAQENGIYKYYFCDDVNAHEVPNDKYPPSVCIIPRPLPRSVLLLDEHHEASLCKLLFKWLVKERFLRKEDWDVFAYLLGVSDTSPISVQRIVWLGDKYELKCLMEVLYPNRRPKEKPDYGDMAKIFCDKNGEQINLKDTPLQCRKKIVNDPVQATREEALIQQIQAILKVL